MDFDLTPEQGLLKDMVDRLAANGEADWRQCAELGLLALPFDPDYGGMGGGPVEMMTVMEAFGRGLVTEPYLATVVLAGTALTLGAPPPLLGALVPRIAEGSLVLAFAHGEAQSRYRLCDVATTARQEGGAWFLEGEKILVGHGDRAGRLVVSARVAGHRRDEAGLALFLLDTATPGILRRDYALHDGTTASDIRLEAVQAEALLGRPGEGARLIEAVHQQGIAAVCAESVGIQAALVELTADYLKTREQFGGPIARFQALQHRAAEMLIAAEQARSMAILGALALEDPDPAARRKSLSAAKVQIGRSGRFVGQQAIQLHGGIGVTQEHKVGQYFKRLTIIESMFGDMDYHLALLAQSGGFIEI